MELASKSFSVDLSVQDLAKKRGEEVGSNPKPGNQGLTRLIYECDLDGEHVLRVKGGGSRKVKGVSDQIGPYSLAIYDIADNKDEIVDFQMNHIFRLNDQERKRPRTQTACRQLSQAICCPRIEANRRGCNQSGIHCEES